MRKFDSDLKDHLYGVSSRFTYNLHGFKNAYETLSNAVIYD